MKYILNDTFNETRISGHRTLDAAVRARIAHARKLSRNSPGSYVWYRIMDANGIGVCSDLVDETELAIQTTSR